MSGLADEKLENPSHPVDQMDGGKLADTKADSVRNDTHLTPRRKARMLKLALAIMVIGIAAALICWSVQPRSLLSVSEVNSKSFLYMGQVVEVRGVIENWDANREIFKLTEEQSYLEVDYSQVPGGLPTGFTLGKHAVIKGKLIEGFISPVLEASEITIGCPSKY